MKRFSARRPLRIACAAVLVAALAACGKQSEDHLAAAKADLEKKDAKSAVLRLRNALQEDPKLGEARYLLGKTLAEAGDLATAEKELRTADSLGYAPDQTVPLLARVQVETGEHKRVVSDLSQRTLSSPEAQADLLVSVANAHLREKNVDGAKAAIAKAAELKPDHPRVLVAQARLKVLDKDLDGAVAQIDETLAKSPDLAEAVRLKAALAQAKDDRATAVKAYQKAADLQSWDVSAHYNATLLLLREGDAAAAKAQVDKMKRAAPRHPATTYLQALLAFSDKNFASAKELVAQSLKVAPTYFPALLLSGQVNLQLGNLEVAEDHLKKALAAQPKSLTARRGLLAVLLRTDRRDQAVEMAQNLLRESPGNPEAMKAAASVYMQVGDTARATGLLEKATAAAPQDSRARTALAVARFREGDEDAAIHELETVSSAEESRVDADVLLVVQYLQKKQFDKALEAAATIERKQPDNPATHNLKGQVLAAAGKLPAARKSFEKALELKADFVPALANLTRLDLAEKKPAEARKRFEAAIARSPKDVTLLLGHADLLRALGAPETEVEKSLQNAIEAVPTDPRTHLALVSFHMQHKDSKKALAAAEAGVKKIAGNVQLTEVLADLQLANGAPEQAVATMQRAVSAHPESAALLVHLADIQASAGFHEAARQSLQNALKIKPDHVDAQSRLVAVEFRAGKPEEALRAARDLQKQRPKDAVGYLLEGDLHARVRKWNEAAAAYRAGLERTRQPAFAVRLHQALTNSGKTQDAEKMAADWIKANPKDPMLRNYLAEQALLQGRYQEAAGRYKELLEIAPNNPLVLNNLAMAAQQLKDPKALQYAEQANKAAPGNPAIMDTLGVILSEKGEHARGLELLKAAADRAQNAPDIRLHYAQALAKAGQKEQARKELEALAKLGDKYPKQAEVGKLLGSL